MSVKLLKVAADPSKIAGVLRDAMPIGDEADPSEVFAYLDRDKNVRRITAKYASGWSIRININAKGQITSSSASVRFGSRVGAQ